MTEATEQVFECNHCGTLSADRDNFIELGDFLYCEVGDCSRTCERCGELTFDDYRYIEDRSEGWCESCCSDHAWYCDGCQQTLSDDCSSYHIWDRASDRCESCLDDFNWCEDCEEYWEDECRCQARGGNNINNYSYKPHPIFHGDTDRRLYFGIEVEAEIWSGDIRGASSDELAKKPDHFYLKEDGSIGHDSPHKGFEIVSHPRSLESWHESDNPVLNYLEHIRDNYKARSWDAKSSCGLHIHISRAGFGSGAHLHRFLWLIYGNAIEMSKLGGRKGSKYASFSDVYKFDDYGRPYRDFRDKTKQGSHTERYSAVNTLNRDTIELRWFQGTTKASGILANIQLAHAMVEYTRYITVAQVREGALRWDRFADYVQSNRTTYPDLADKVAKIDSINLGIKQLIEA